MPVKPGIPAVPGAADHGALTGLADDDHSQYHNNTRGDARYHKTVHFDNNSGSGVQNVGNTETDLFSHQLDANKLANVGDLLIVTAIGVFANNTNNKRLQLYLGSSVFWDSGTQPAVGFWRVNAIVARNAQNLQGIAANFAADAIFGLPNEWLYQIAEDLAVDNLLKLTGTGVSNGDIFVGGWFWEKKPAP